MSSRRCYIVSAEILRRLRGDDNFSICLTKVLNRAVFCKRYSRKFLVFSVVMVLFWRCLCCNFAVEMQV